MGGLLVESFEIWLMAKFNLVPAFFIAAITAFGIGQLPSQASSFIDNFDDEILDSRYQVIGNSVITEESGAMIVNMPGSGDGVSISIDDVVPDAKWHMFELEVSEFVVGHSLVMDFLGFDDQGNHQATIRNIFSPTNSTDIWVKYFDADFNEKAKLHKTQDFDFEGEFDIWFDFIDGEWQTTIHRLDDPANLRLKLSNIFDPEFLEKLGWTEVNIYTSGIDTDPIVAINSYGAESTAMAHVPEPTSTLSILTLGTLGAAGLLRRQRKG